MLTTSERLYFINESLSIIFNNKDYLKLIEKIIEFSNLEFGWNGAEGEPLNISCALNSIELLKILDDKFINPPQCSLNAKGIIEFYYNDKGVFVDFDINEENLVSYYIKNKDKIFGEDDVSLYQINNKNFLIKTLKEKFSY